MKTQAASRNGATKPRHVAIIMDGNGRWARGRGQPRTAGHRAGVKAARRVVEACVERRIETLSLFTFSSENFSRPQTEVNVLMRLFVEALEREVAELNEQNVRLLFVGERSRLSSAVRSRIENAERLTGGNRGLTLIIALAYGGRWDIVNAARKIGTAIGNGSITPEAIDEKLVAENLSLAGIPDPDLLIRTGGEHRISNFLLWNLAYTELFFSSGLWPDFDGIALDEALAWFADRERRYGLTAEQQDRSGART